MRMRLHTGAALHRNCFSTDAVLSFITHRDEIPINAGEVSGQSMRRADRMENEKNRYAIRLRFDNVCAILYSSLLCYQWVRVALSLAVFDFRGTKRHVSRSFPGFHEKL